MEGGRTAIDRVTVHALPSPMRENSVVADPSIFFRTATTVSRPRPAPPPRPLPAAAPTRSARGEEERAAWTAPRCPPLRAASGASGFSPPGWSPTAAPPSSWAGWSAGERAAAGGAGTGRTRGGARQAAAAGVPEAEEEATISTTESGQGS